MILLSPYHIMQLLKVTHSHLVPENLYNNYYIYYLNVVENEKL